MSALDRFLLHPLMRAALAAGAALLLVYLAAHWRALAHADAAMVALVVLVLGLATAVLHDEAARRKR